MLAKPRTKGSTGPAPTTVWMSTVADRLTQCIYWDYTIAGNGAYAWQAANYANKWFIKDSISFGAFTTAPDGSTNTAQLLVEGTANSAHDVIAGDLKGSQRYFGRQTHAGIFKSSNRRVGLRYYFSANNRDGGIEAVFDLVNGQVGVDTGLFAGSDPIPTDFGYSLQFFPAQIKALGSGWYLCSFDTVISAGITRLCLEIFIDNGTGTNPTSRTYAGDGSSGVYGWKTSSLPTTAWGINNVVFFDDFNDNTMSNFDLANTKDPSKTWFVDWQWSGWNYDPLSGPKVPTNNPAQGVWSVHDSMLDITFQQLPYTVSTAAPLTAPNYVGKSYKAPGLFETRMKWNWHLGGAGVTLRTVTNSFWTTSVEFASTVAIDHAAIGREFDWQESFKGPNCSQPSFILYYVGYILAFDGSAIGARPTQSPGVPEWLALTNYRTDDLAHLNGVAYRLTGDNVQNDPPPSANWATWVHPPFPTPPSQPPSVSAPLLDWRDFHTFTSLLVPWLGGSGKDDMEHHMLWVDDIYIGDTASNNPFYNDCSSTRAYTTNHHTYPMILAGAKEYPTQYDWVKVWN